MATDNQDNMTAVLRGFFEHWAQKERGGIVSPLNRLEVMAIELFADWLGDNYELAERGEHGTSTEDTTAAG